ncbi:MAG: hypothetical protein OXI55_14600 [Gammaproteobacteria bacterium]|nr:hypothetical protein [Gammaproteobacteria bacterium]
MLYQIVKNRKTGRVRVVELPCDPRPQLRAGLFLLQKQAELKAAARRFEERLR